jgi:hypothetical protein
MQNENEKTLRRFEVFDTQGNLLSTVNITHQSESPDMFGHASYAHTMGRAMLSAENLHLYAARKKGLIVKQVLL